MLCRQRHVAEYATQQISRTWRPIAPTKIKETALCSLVPVGSAAGLRGSSLSLAIVLRYGLATQRRSPMSPPFQVLLLWQGAISSSVHCHSLARHVTF